MYRQKLITSFILIMAFAVGTLLTVICTVDAEVEESMETTTTALTVATITTPTTILPTDTPTPSPTPTATPTPSPVNEDDLYLMAHLIWGEAGYDHEEMMYAIGSVVLNRVNHSAYPNSISGVIYQSGQYACTWDGNFNKTPSELAWQIAEDLLANGSTLPENVVYQAQFVQGSGIYCQIDNEYFCYY